MHIHVVLDVSVSMGGSCGQGALIDGLTDSCALQVNQGNMPGIQSTFLAMDTEEGVEVVWNELLFTDKKAFKAHEVIAPGGEECAHGSLCLLYPKSSFSPDLEPLPTFLCSLCSPAVPPELPSQLSFLCIQEKIKTMFEQLVLVDHPNIVKLHKYWLDVKDSKARVGDAGVRCQAWRDGGGIPGSSAHPAPRIPLLQVGNEERFLL